MAARCSYRLLGAGNTRIAKDRGSGMKRIVTSGIEAIRPAGPYAALAGLVVLFFALGSPREIVLLDKPRNAADPSDFVCRFLQSTSTPHSFRNGFVVLPVGSATQSRLLELAAALDVACRNAARAESSRSQAERPAAFLTASDESGVAASPRLLDAIEPLEELRRQYSTVVEAIRLLNPGAAGPRVERAYARWSDENPPGRGGRSGNEPPLLEDVEIVDAPELSTNPSPQ